MKNLPWDTARQGEDSKGLGIIEDILDMYIVGDTLTAILEDILKTEADVQEELIRDLLGDTV